jgi:hypothetical protein
MLAARNTPPLANWPDVSSGHFFLAALMISDVGGILPLAELRSALKRGAV